MLRKYWLFLLFPLLLIYCSNLYWGGERWRGHFLADSGGYYAYLPAVFIYHDLHFGFIDQVKHNGFENFQNFDSRIHYNGQALNKTFAGTAIAMMPFFLAAHTAASWFGFSNDGYNLWYAAWINVAAVFYLCIGLFALRNLLVHFLGESTLVSILVLLTLFATNLFYYSTSEPAMSHVYSFAFINLFLLIALRYVSKPNLINGLLAGTLLGLVVLIRPVNIITVAIVPLFSSGTNQLIEWIRNVFRNWMSVLAGATAFAILFSIQFIIYRIQTGHFIIDSYGDEGFNFGSPQLINFLFSYKKGLFVYMPVMMLSVFGLLHLWSMNKFRFTILFLFAVSWIYISASWWNWWYGGSFGTRVLVDFLFVPVLLIGYSYYFFKSKKSGWLYSILCVFFVFHMLLQTYQYRYYYIHWDKMDKEHFWNVFMRIDLVVKNKNPNLHLKNTE